MTDTQLTRALDEAEAIVRRVWRSRPGAPPDWRYQRGQRLLALESLRRDRAALRREAYAACDAAVHYSRGHAGPGVSVATALAAAAGVMADRWAAGGPGGRPA